MSETTQKPSLVLPRGDQIPAELRPLKRWCGFRFEWEEPKWKKPPYSPVDGTRIGAVTKYLDQFLTFDEALAGVIKHQHDGIGFVFMEGDGYVGVDFDDCIENGLIDSFVSGTLKNSLPSYAEISPSGTGIHVICRGKIAKALTASPIGDGSATVEMYNTGRYFTFTGQQTGDYETIAGCQFGINKIIAHVTGLEPSANKTTTKNQTENERPWSKFTARRTHANNLAAFKAMTKPNDPQNDTLNSAAFFAARAFAAGALEGTEASIKKEIRDIANSTPHCPGVEQTLASGWSKGIGKPLPLIEYIQAVAVSEYCAERPKEAPYIIKGVLYRGAASQLMGPIKAGKTTWLFAALHNIMLGQDFMGLKTEPTNILYITEQPRASFQAQLSRSGLDKNQLLRQAQLYVLDLGHLWNLDWEGRSEQIRENVSEKNIGLVVIDTFPRVALVEEMANIGEMNRKFETIAPVVNDGAALMLVWHERKAGGSIFEAAAGTAASGGAVDMLLRLQRAQGSPLSDRTRQFEIMGRFPAAFEETVTIQLNNDMSNYAFLGSKQAAVRRSTEQRILDIVPQDSALTREEIMERLAETAEAAGLEPAAATTVRRALTNMVEHGLLVLSGDGTKEEPYRFQGVQSPFG